MYIYIYKQDLALNNQQWSIYQKIKPNQTKLNQIYLDKTNKQTKNKISKRSPSLKKSTHQKTTRIYLSIYVCTYVFACVYGYLYTDPSVKIYDIVLYYGICVNLFFCLTHFPV